MNTLLRWLKALEEVEWEDPSALAPTFRRVLVPGTEPLDISGTLVRLQPISAIDPAHTWPGRVPHSLSVAEWLMPTASAVSPADVATDLSALLTFVANRRIEVLGNEYDVVREGTSQRIFLPGAQIPDRSLYGTLPLGIKDDLIGTLSALASLQSDDLRHIAAAMALHYDACLIMESDSTGAYAMLVGGLEALSRGFGSPPADWLDWDDHVRWDDAFARLGLGTEAVQTLRKMLVEDKQIRLRRTFAEYASTRLPDEFWSGVIEDPTPGFRMEADRFTFSPEHSRSERVPIALLVPSDRGQLRRSLLRSYDVRSDYVHQGARGFEVHHAVAALGGAQEGEPVPFAGLRYMLTTLIRRELSGRSDEYELPDVVINPPS